MADVDVNRSVRFVSLDTHPANNSLVVTYEILISVVENATNRELTRRSKRDQLQINISPIDNLIEDELKQSDRLALNLRTLSEDILLKCPLLASSSLDNQNIIEDIQLHLLYLINRKQTQLISAKNPLPNRPQSSLSMGRPKSTLKDSNRQLASRGSSGRQRSALSSSGSSRESVRDIDGDVYDYLLAKEKSTGARSEPDYQWELIDKFMQQFESHLEELELNLSGGVENEQPLRSQADLESKLEGLYGEEAEKLASIVSIRKASCENQHLLWMSSNRILVRAILRTLRDTRETLNDDDNHSQLLLRESILFCLIRMTTYEDIYNRLFVDNKDDVVDLLGVILGLMDELVKLLLKLDEYKLIHANYYHLNSLLVLIMNLLLFQIQGQQDSKPTKQTNLKLIQVHQSKLVDSSSGLLSLFAKYLSRDLRQSSIINRQDRVITSSLSRLLDILQVVSVYREFIQLYRTPKQQKPATSSLDCLVNILNILQLSRPGSGTSTPASNQSQLAVVIRDQATLNEIYELEVNIFKLINNFLLDSRLRTRIMKKSLPLKCILRNLIVFLATKSRTSNTLSPFNRSSTLLVPFRCLYELSCSDQIKAELFKSRIIIKCLLEFLLSSSTDLKSTLGLVASTRVDLSSRPSRHRNETTNEIIIEPNDASHYIVCLWLNLSSKPEAPFYQSSETDETHEPIREYFELTLENLAQFVTISSRTLTNSNKAKCPINRDVHLMIYIHVKLLRNLSQFFKFASSNMEPSQLVNWCEQLSKTSDFLLGRSDVSEFALLSVECLAILTHLIQLNAHHDHLTSLDSSDTPVESSKCLLIRLLEVDFMHHLDAENDDLILVSINFLGTLAKYYEICPEIQIIFVKLLEACDFVLENKLTDTEMIVSCLFTLNQLLEHKSFLQETINALSGDTLANGHHGRPLIDHLLDKLASLVAHGDLSVTRLANLILNKVKQLEELASLSDSLACEKRFASYNCKWLAGVASGDDDDDGTGETSDQEVYGGGAGLGHGRQSRLIDANEAPRVAEDSVDGAGEANTEDDQQEDNKDDDGDELELELEEDESFAEEPDLNVIDANSMIRHLTSRRQFRAEWLNMKR